MALLRREYVFDADINGGAHTIKFYKAKGKYHLLIDDEPKAQYRPSGFMSLLFEDIDDYEYDYDGTKITLAVRYNKVRLAINDICTDTTEKLRRVCVLPKWAIVFVLAILIPPVVLSVHMFDLMIGVLCSYLCTHYIFKNPDIKATVARKTVYCVIITICYWASIWLFNYAQ